MLTADGLDVPTNASGYGTLAGRALPTTGLNVVGINPCTFECTMNSDGAEFNGAEGGELPVKTSTRPASAGNDYGVRRWGRDEARFRIKP